MFECLAGLMQICSDIAQMCGNNAVCGVLNFQVLRVSYDLGC